METNAEIMLHLALEVCFFYAFIKPGFSISQASNKYRFLIFFPHSFKPPENLACRYSFLFDKHKNAVERQEQCGKRERGGGGR